MTLGKLAYKKERVVTPCLGIRWHDNCRRPSHRRVRCTGKGFVTAPIVTVHRWPFGPTPGCWNVCCRRSCHQERTVVLTPCLQERTVVLTSHRAVVLTASSDTAVLGTLIFACAGPVRRLGARTGTLLSTDRRRRAPNHFSFKRRYFFRRGPRRSCRVVRWMPGRWTVGRRSDTWSDTAPPRCVVRSLRLGFRKKRRVIWGRDESERHGAESQWIVAARPLCHLQYPVAYLSRLQRILPATRW